MIPVLIQKPARVASAGTKPKLIDEYIGQLNSGTHPVSVAHMRSPQGWVEPGQTPDFDEYTLVLNGMLRVEYRDDGAESGIDVHAGQAVITSRGQWVRYSTPDAAGAEYVAICIPAFTMDTVHRDEE